MMYFCIHHSHNLAVMEVYIMTFLLDFTVLALLVFSTAALFAS